RLQGLVARPFVFGKGPASQQERDLRRLLHGERHQFHLRRQPGKCSLARWRHLDRYQFHLFRKHYFFSLPAIGIGNSSATVTITGSTFSENSTSGNGGAISARPTHRSTRCSARCKTTSRHPPYSPPCTWPRRGRRIQLHCQTCPRRCRTWLPRCPVPRTHR